MFYFLLLRFVFLVWILWTGSHNGVIVYNTMITMMMITMTMIIETTTITTITRTAMQQQ